MKLKLFMLILIALLLNSQAVLAAENEYGMVKAWFNEKNATVEDFSMKIGEPGDIKISITSNISGHVFIEISEPGVTKAYDILSGPSKQDERIDNLNIEAGWTKTYTWRIAPNGAWKNGNAPINVLVSFYNIKKKIQKPLDFTIANPYILDEQYSGSTPSQTTGAAQPSPASTAPKQAPFLPSLFVICTLIMAWNWKRKGGRHSMKTSSLTQQY